MTIQRPNPSDLMLDLTRRLAEEFATVPLPMVSHAVRGAASAAELFGSEVDESLATIERIAREDLAAVQAAGEEQRALHAAS